MKQRFGDCLSTAEALAARLVEGALCMKASRSGEYGQAAFQLMRALKHALDPENLMNPGKILPPA